MGRTKDISVEDWIKYKLLVRDNPVARVWGGALLRKWRELSEARLTLADVAHYAGRSVATLSNNERGEFVPSPTVLRAYAAILGFSLCDYLMMVLRYGETGVAAEQVYTNGRTGNRLVARKFVATEPAADEQPAIV